MQSNTEIKYIDSNGNNCSPLPIIETTITNPNSLPLKSGIYVNETGFSVYLGSSATSTTNVKMIEQRVNVHNSSTYTLTYIHQTTYDQSNSVYIRTGSLYLNAGSTTGSTAFASSYFNKILDSTGSIAKQVGQTTIGSPVIPIYLAGGYPTAFSNTIGSPTQPIYMNEGTLTAGNTLVGKSTEGQIVTINDASVTCSTGAEIFNDYTNNKATGEYAHAEGYNTIAQGARAHAEGYNTYAKSNNSHAEGSGTTANGNCAHAEGYSTAAQGFAAHAEGQNCKAAGDYSHATGMSTTANDFQTVIGKYNKSSAGPTGATDTTGDIFIIGNGTISTSLSNAFRVTTAGTAYGCSSFKGSGADYAEMWEWADGNIDNEDRRGYFVTVDENNKIRIATPDDYILGVTSATPVVVGDVQSEEWHEMYLKDVFGEKLTEVVEVEETTDEDGNVIPAHTETRFILNPKYDSTQKYISRDERKEWQAIGLMGKLVVVDDGTCVPGSYCTVAADGTGTATTDKSGWRVLKRFDETHIQILYR